MKKFFLQLWNLLTVGKLLRDSDEFQSLKAALKAMKDDPSDETRRNLLDKLADLLESEEIDELHKLVADVKKEVKNKNK